jgi:hypothetical protein
MKYFRYLSYVVRHKWYVFVACCRLGIPLRGLAHDLSKFRPREFIPYAHHFFAPQNVANRETGQQGYFKPADTENLAFELAWLYHLHANPHHWQWHLKHPTMEPMTMPLKLVKEMLADWYGAGMAQHKPDIIAWYLQSATKIILEPHTAFMLRNLMNKNSKWLCPKGTSYEPFRL